jgi:regulator of replication initiation timing
MTHDEQVNREVHVQIGSLWVEIVTLRLENRILRERLAALLPKEEKAVEKVEEKT